MQSEVRLDLPPQLQERYKDIPYNIHLIDMGEVENAFASLGGNVYITTAFLEQVEYWEELDFILGHEIGHIENRDVLKSLISEFPVVIVLSLFGGEYGGVLFEWVISNTHSKIQETKADEYGIDFTHAVNSHIGCALWFFEKTNSLWDNVLEVFSTHPVTTFRIDRAFSYAEKRGYEEAGCNEFNYSPIEVWNE